MLATSLITSQKMLARRGPRASILQSINGFLLGARRALR